jgi:hypothetical protein
VSAFPSSKMSGVGLNFFFDLLDGSAKGLLSRILRDRADIWARLDLENPEFKPRFDLSQEGDSSTASFSIVLLFVRRCCSRELFLSIA